MLDCVKCHKKGTDTFNRTFGNDVDRYKVATRSNCTTCHDNTSFAGETTLTVDGVANIAAVGHTGGTQATDSGCSGCHPSTGADYDISVTGAHTVWEKSSMNPGFLVKALYATNIAPGSYPRVYFQMTDASGLPVTPDSATAAPFKNTVNIDMAIKPKNIPDFLNDKLSSDNATNGFPVGSLTSGSGGSTASVAISGSSNSASALTSAPPTGVTWSDGPTGTMPLQTVDASRGIYFVNFSTATSSPKAVPTLTGNYAGGATTAPQHVTSFSFVDVNGNTVTSATYMNSQTKCTNCHDPHDSTLTARFNGSLNSVDPDIIGFEGFSTAYTHNRYTPVGFLHDRIGLDSSFVDGFGNTLGSDRGPCVVCHYTATDTGAHFAHSLDALPIASGSGLTAVIANPTVAPAQCADSHTGSFAFANGANTLSDLNTIKGQYKAGLDAIAALLKARYGIFYTGGDSPYPYFFTDAAFTHSKIRWDAKALAGGDTRSADTAGRRLAGAAFKLNLLTREPGAYAHNQQYSMTLIFDTMDYLEDGKIDGVLNGTTFVPLTTLQAIFGNPVTRPIE